MLLANIQRYIELQSNQRLECSCPCVQSSTISTPISEPIPIPVGTTTRSSQKKSKISLRRYGTTAKPKPPRAVVTFSPEETLQRIREYHMDAEQRCLDDFANDTHPNGYYCPCLPTVFRELTIALLTLTLTCSNYSEGPLNLLTD